MRKMSAQLPPMWANYSLTVVPKVEVVRDRKAKLESQQVRFANANRVNDSRPNGDQI